MEIEIIEEFLKQEIQDGTREEMVFRVERTEQGVSVYGQGEWLQNEHIEKNALPVVREKPFFTVTGSEPYLAGEDWKTALYFAYLEAMYADKQAKFRLEHGATESFTPAEWDAYEGLNNEILICMNHKYGGTLYVVILSEKACPDVFLPLQPELNEVYIVPHKDEALKELVLNWRKTQRGEDMMAIIARIKEIGGRVMEWRF